MEVLVEESDKHQDDGGQRDEHKQLIEDIDRLIDIVQAAGDGLPIPSKLGDSHNELVQRNIAIAVLVESPECFFRLCFTIRAQDVDEVFQEQDLSSFNDKRHPNTLS